MSPFILEDYSQPLFLITIGISPPTTLLKALLPATHYQDNGSRTTAISFTLNHEEVLAFCVHPATLTDTSPSLMVSMLEDVSTHTGDDDDVLIGLHDMTK